MSGRGGWARAARVAAAVLVALVLLPVVTGRPVVAYAKSGSMEPTLGTFDVFLVNPWPGALREGDIVVFDSLSRGEPAVHRIVGGGPEGWLTQGDANPGMDQLAGEPLVTPDRIKGRVVTGFDGEPLRARGLAIPLLEARAEWAKLENRAGGPQKLQSLLFLALAVSFALPLLLRRREPLPPAPSPFPRGPRRALRAWLPRGVLGRHLALAFVLLSFATAGWCASQARSEVPLQTIVVRDPAAADGLRATAPGGSVTREVLVGSLGLLPTLAVVSPGTPAVEVSEESVRLAPWTRDAVPVRVVGGAEHGVQEDSVVVWRYPAALPEPATLALHGIAPGTPFAFLALLASLAGWLWLRALGVLDLPVGRWVGLREGWL